MLEAHVYLHKLIAYTGDNQNVVTWLSSRKAKNALARFFLRMLSRLEHKYCFHAYPLYISPMNNIYCDKLTRLNLEESHRLAKGRGWEFLSVDKLLQWLLPGNLPRLILAQPCDSSEQTDFLKQLVEKRTYRKIPHMLTSDYHFVLLGQGAGNAQRLARSRPEFSIECFGWPSEGCNTVPTNIRPQSLAIFPHPPSPLDWDYAFKTLAVPKPTIVLFELHPKHVMTPYQKSGLNLSHSTTWNWDINCSILGSSTSRIRSVWVLANHTFGITPPTSTIDD